MRIVLSFKLAILFFQVTYFIGLAPIHSQANQPYKALNGGYFVSGVNKFSPDPLVNYRWNSIDANDSLQVYKLGPIRSSSNPSTSFVDLKDSIRVEGNGAIMFDFGVESAGWLEFESDDLSGDIEMSISEYNEPAIVNAGAQSSLKTKKPIKYGKVYRLELNDKLYEGVRFGWVHVTNYSKPWHIKNVRLVCQTKPANYDGSFMSNDSILNRIWYTGAYTVKLNLLHDYFGAILMERSDRHSWTGDAYPAQAASLAAFGNYEFVKKNIEFTSTQNNGIASYSIYWVLGLIDYYYYSGDLEFLREQLQNAENRLDLAYQHFDNLPNLVFMGWDERLGAGFESSQIPEAKNTYRMLCINAWSRFAKVMSLIGEDELSDRFARYAKSKIESIISNNYESDVAKFGVHAISEAINAGLADLNVIKNRSEKLFNDRQNRLSYSPFNQYFIIQALAKEQKKTKALTTIKDQWGGQLKNGATTFYEVFRPSWNNVLDEHDAPPNNQCGYTSLAHPWGAGVTEWLSKNVLGVKPVEPGFKSFVVEPFMTDSLTRIKGRVPTPHGNISLDFNLESGTVQLEVPYGTIAKKVGIPKIGQQIDSLLFYDQVFRRKDVLLTKDSIELEEDDEYVYLENLLPGRYELRIVYDYKTDKLKEYIEPLRYEINRFAYDSITMGNWKEKYGKDGYILLGKPDYASTRFLPSYIDSLSTRYDTNRTWHSKSQDSEDRILDGINSNEKHRAALTTTDPKSTFQTMTIDVYAKQGKPYTISLYFLDWNNLKRRSALEIFDLNSLELLAPLQLLKDYENGKYLSFTVDRPIRLRINQIRGENASLSGIFFDRP